MLVVTCRPEKNKQYGRQYPRHLFTERRTHVLVDTPITIEQTNALIDWITASGKNLTTIYITHGHGDHWFGIGALLDRFPKARAVAKTDVVRVMRQQASPESIANFWGARFPGQIPERLVIAEELKEILFDLEGQKMVAVDVGHTDSDFSTVLHVPSASLVVAGDAGVQRCPSYDRRIENHTKTFRVDFRAR